MKIAFVGVKRKYQELALEYRETFNRFHLELPYYYSRDGRNDVTITTVDYSDPRGGCLFAGLDSEPIVSLDCQQEKEFVASSEEFDVVVHWRRWHPELYRPEAINVVNCQDHSFGPEWQGEMRRAFEEAKLFGVLCFPTWHKRNLLAECPWLPSERAIDGLTLGVDVDVYRPSAEKDPRQMLWAADPGRGLGGAFELALCLFRRDRRWRLHVCWPDYAVRNFPGLAHPAVVVRGNVSNGPGLQKIFNETGVLPYTSSFREPSSRCHRQAQAAGSLVCYPPAMGSPSELIESGKDGVVAPIEEWPGLIEDLVESGRWKEIGERARARAVSESWAVQAGRFNAYFGEKLKMRRSGGSLR